MTLLASEPQNALEPDALLRVLQDEFHRLNAAHCGAQMTMPEIVLSRRKTYGGYYQPKTHRIVLSLQAYREHGWSEILNTFRHEVAHIIHPNHSPAFWRLARAMGAAQRYARAPLTPRRAPRKKYVYVCDACGQQLARLRRIRNASCGTCDKRYNPRFPLRLVSAQ